MRDHIVSVPDEENCDEATAAQIRVLNDLLLHRDDVCVSNNASTDQDSPSSSSEKIQDCDPVWEPTLLGPLRGDNGSVRLSPPSSLSVLFVRPP